MIDGARIVEMGLKCLVWMIDAGFLLGAFTFLGTGVLAIRDKIHDRKEDDKRDGMIIGMFILAILCGIITAIFFGLAIMPWWS